VNITSRHTGGGAKGENQMNPIQETEPFILVEGPRWADAEFYGKWLLMATKTQALWEKTIKDTRFKKQIARLTVLHHPQFDHIASLFLFQLKENLVSFTFPLYSEDWAAVEQFTLMAEMGFFVLTDQRYQMVIPTKLNTDVVKSAALSLATTEDEDGAHPEYLVAMMPYAQAEEWQARLRYMNQEQRCANRAVLLEGHLVKQLNKREVGGCYGRSKRPHRKDRSARPRRHLRQGANRSRRIMKVCSSTVMRRRSKTS
jgi:hypothetical protein